ncbi:MAG: 50S ribosomal protein L4 [Candidatus Daviesbacteria bacterium]|nr:50S ribosomal protein L4 [Candidatus Daviesbacteria bacterium]
MVKNSSKLDKSKNEKALSIKPQAPSLSVPIYSLEGKEEGKMELPKEIFGGKINTPLLIQALRVYQNNLKSHFSNTKTRGEVQGSTRKIYKQKGTGGARHGSIRAPIFVHGGVALGPKFRNVVLDLPEKMKKSALLSALSEKVKNEELSVLEGVDKLKGKTSELKNLVATLSKKNLLLVTGDKNDQIKNAAHNLGNVSVQMASQINVLDIVRNSFVLLTRDAVEKLDQRLGRKVVTREESK